MVTWDDSGGHWADALKEAGWSGFKFRALGVQGVPKGSKAPRTQLPGLGTTVISYVGSYLGEI